jgi:hypothetical protein
MNRPRMSMPKSIAGSTWPVLGFALIILDGGLWAMAALTSDVTAAAITTLSRCSTGLVRPRASLVARTRHRLLRAVLVPR